MRRCGRCGWDEEYCFDWTSQVLHFSANNKSPKHTEMREVKRGLHYLSMAGWRWFHVKGSDRIGAAVSDVLGQ